MTPNRNFDPVAHIYDATRLLPDAVRDVGLSAVIESFPPDALVLDAGTGTGRIAVPLLEMGVDIVGIDVSMNMMARQQAKYPAAQLTQGSVTHMPFGRATFDVVLTAHVLHLIPDWRAALAEFRRVLRPNGVYLNIRSEPMGRSPWQESAKYWRDWLEEREGRSRGEDLGTWDQSQIEAALLDMGAQLTTREVVTHETRYTLGERIDGLRMRSASSTWDVPEDLLQAGADALEVWVIDNFGGLDVELTEEQVFRIYSARFVESQT